EVAVSLHAHDAGIEPTQPFEQGVAVHQLGVVDHYHRSRPPGAHSRQRADEPDGHVIRVIAASDDDDLRPPRRLALISHALLPLPVLVPWRRATRLPPINSIGTRPASRMIRPT